MNTTANASNEIQSNLPQKVGEFVSKSNHNLSPAQLRRKGLALGVGIAVMGGIAGPAFIKRFNTVNGTSIPATQNNINPDKYKFEAVPPTGAWTLAEQADPNHDPRNGVGSFDEQLGHDVKPGDIVAVPKQTER